jgi:hypothetical protein
MQCILYTVHHIVGAPTNQQVTVRIAPITASCHTCLPYIRIYNIQVNQVNNNKASETKLYSNNDVCNHGVRQDVSDNKSLLLLLLLSFSFPVLLLYYVR